METLLEPRKGILEESTLWRNRYSKVEGEILAILRRPAMSPQSLVEFLDELTPTFLESQVWQGLRNLLDDGLIRMVYTTGFEIGFEWA